MPPHGLGYRFTSMSSRDGRDPAGAVAHQRFNAAGDDAAALAAFAKECDCSPYEFRKRAGRALRAIDGLTV